MSPGVPPWDVPLGTPQVPPGISPHGTPGVSPRVPPGVSLGSPPGTPWGSDLPKVWSRLSRGILGVSRGYRGGTLGGSTGGSLELTIMAIRFPAMRVPIPASKLNAETGNVWLWMVSFWALKPQFLTFSIVSQDHGCSESSYCGGSLRTSARICFAQLGFRPCASALADAQRKTTAIGTPASASAAVGTAAAAGGYWG